MLHFTNDFIDTHISKAPLRKNKNHPHVLLVVEADFQMVSVVEDTSASYNKDHEHQVEGVLVFSMVVVVAEIWKVKVEVTAGN